MIIVSPDHYERLSSSFERIFGRPLPAYPHKPANPVPADLAAQMLADPDLFADVDTGRVPDFDMLTEQAIRSAG